MIKVDESEDVVAIKGTAPEVMCDILLLFKEIIEDEEIYNKLTSFTLKEGCEEMEQFKYFTKIVNVMKELKGETK